MTDATSAERWAAVKELFWAASEAPADAREQLLVERTSSDEIRAEVRRLLAAADDVGDRFEQPAIASLGDAPFSDDVDDEVPSLVGRRLGTYEVVRRVAEGGMGTVYEAVRADDAFRQRVAIKTVWRGVDSTVLAQRLRSERQILASLAHPNIARLLDGGSTADGQPYLVMEFVDGEPIDAYCDARRLSIDARLALFEQVCAAVQHAHSHLTVHRDLKPSNVLVTPASAGVDAVVKLLDFGVAKLLDDGERVGTLTAAGLSPFTAGFAAPEQVSRGRISTATDVYALGAMLHVLLTGRAPFDADRLDAVEAIVAIRDRPAPPPSELTSDAAAVARGLPNAKRLARTLRGELDAIVRATLRKEPERRYATADALAADVRRYRRGERVLARPDTFGYRVRTFTRRHLAPVVVSVFLLLALLGGAVTTELQARRARSAQQRAERVGSFLRELLTAVRPEAGGRDVPVSAVLVDAGRRVDRELADEPATRAELETVIGKSFQALGRYDEAAPHLARALALYERGTGAASEDAVIALGDVGGLALSRGELDRADSLFGRALVLARSRARAPDTVVATLLDNLGSVAHGRGNDTTGERLHREALSLRQRALPMSHDLIAYSLNNVAVSLGEQGRWADAEVLHRQAIAILRANHPGAYPLVADALSSLATALDLQGKTASAESAYVDVIAMRRTVLGPDHPDYAFTVFNYAGFAFDHGEYQRALELSRELLALRGRTLPASHPAVAGSLQTLGRSLDHLGDTAAGERALEESLALRRANLPADSWLIANSEGILGEHFALVHRFDRAEPLLLRADRVLTATFGETSQRTQNNLRRIVAMYDSSGRPARATPFRARLQTQH